MQKRIIKNIFTIAKLTLGLSIFLLLIHFVGPEKILLATLHFNFFLIFPATLLYAPILLLGTLNLKILLNPLKKINFWYLFTQYYKSWSIGLFVPGKIGEFSLSYFLGKKIRVGNTAAIILIDKLVSLLVLSSFAIVGFMLFYNWNIAFQVSALLTLGISAFLILFSKKRLRKDLSYIILGKHKAIFSGFSGTFFEYLKKRKRLVALNLALTLVRTTLQSLIVFSVFMGYGLLEVNFLFLVFVLSSITIISIIPISISGLGVRESSFVILCSKINIPPEISASAIIILTLLKYSVATLGINLTIYKGNVKNLICFLKKPSTSEKKIRG